MHYYIVESSEEINAQLAKRGEILKKTHSNYTEVTAAITTYFDTKAGKYRACAHTFCALDGAGINAKNYINQYSIQDPKPVSDAKHEQANHLVEDGSLADYFSQNEDNPIVGNERILLIATHHSIENGYYVVYPFKDPILGDGFDFVLPKSHDELLTIKKNINEICKNIAYMLSM